MKCVVQYAFNALTMLVGCHEEQQRVLKQLQLKIWFQSSDTGGKKSTAYSSNSTWELKYLYTNFNYTDQHKR